MHVLLCGVPSLSSRLPVSAGTGCSAGSTLSPARQEHVTALLNAHAQLADPEGAGFSTPQLEGCVGLRRSIWHKTRGNSSEIPDELSCPQKRGGQVLCGSRVLGSCAWASMQGDEFGGRMCVGLGAWEEHAWGWAHGRGVHGTGCMGGWVCLVEWEQQGPCTEGLSGRQSTGEASSL